MALMPRFGRGFFHRKPLVTFPGYSTQSGFPGLAVEAALDYPITDGVTGLTWTDLSTSVERVSWSRGRSYENDVFEPGSCDIYLRRPSVPITQWVHFDGSTGNNITTPDTAATSVTGDLDVRIKVALPDWVPSTEQTLIAKFQADTDDRAWSLSIDTDGTIRFLRSSSGLVAFAGAIRHGITDGGIPICLRVTYVSGATTVTFYKSDTGQAWETIGADDLTGGALFDAACPIEIGSRNNGTSQMTGNVYWAEVRNGINGPVVARFDATNVDATGAQTPTTVPSETGETWTINGSAWQWSGQNSTLVAPILKPLTHLRIRTAYAGVEREQIHAYVDKWDEQYAKTKVAVAKVSATDGLKVLSAVVSPSPWERKLLTSTGKRHWYRMNAPSLIPGIGGLSYLDAYGYDQVGSAHMLWDVDNGPADSLVKGESNGASKDNRLVGAGGVLMTTAFPMTVLCWVNTTSTAAAGSNPTIWGHGRAPSMPSTATENLLLYVRENSSEKPRMLVSAGASFTIDSTIAITSGPHLLAFSWDGATGSNKARLWHGSANGFRKSYYASPSATASLTLTSRQTIIGGGFDSGASTTWDWNGTIDEVVVWGRVLTTGELDGLFASGGHRYGTYDNAGGVMVDLLNTVDWPADLVSITTSAGLEVPTLKWYNPKGQPVLSLLRDIAFSDRGSVFMHGDGTVKFVPHDTIITSTLYTVEQLTFSSSAGAVPYSDIHFEYDDRQVLSEVQVDNEAIVFLTSTLTSSGLVDYRVISQSTVKKDFYMPRSLDLSLKINTDGDPATIISKMSSRATYELRQAEGPRRRIKKITVKPMRDPTNIWPRVLNLDLLQRVGVKHRPPDGSTISQSLTIEGITHDYDVRSRDWSVTFDLGFRST